MSEVGHRTLQEAEDIASSRGLVCVEADVYELFIDLDGTPVSLANLHALHTNGFAMLYDCLFTRSAGGNRHLYLRLEKAADLDTRIAMQVCIGSDSMRESLSLCRVKSGSEAPIVLFEAPEEAGRVYKWRHSFQSGIHRALTQSDILSKL